MMRLLRIFGLASCAVAAAVAHPMGNFSVSHYARFDVRPGGIDLTYVLDLAEIPTFELVQGWNIDAADRSAIVAHAGDQGRAWLSGLRITVDGRPVRAAFRSAKAQILDGAGGMAVLRVAVSAFLPEAGGSIDYEDLNYPSRTGWKEVVIVPHEGTALASATHGAQDLSHALESYPVDATSAPPQDTKASFQWSGVAPAAAAIRTVEKSRPAGRAPAPLEAASAAPVGTPKSGPSFSEQQQSKAMGTVVRGDYLSRMLRGRQITFGMLLIGVCVAFGLGAVHALSPGHGKTIVAAYLVGSRGTMKHALFLGGMVTFTHTISVFALGVGVLFFQQYVVPEKVIPVLGTISGLSIVAIGAMLLYQRTKKLAETGHVHSHGEHSHGHEPVNDHVHHSHEGHDHDHHDHDHGHPHEHGHTHSHGGRPHSHVPEGKLTLTSLIALGVSGGLVPCPSALVLLLSAIALGRTALGLILLVGFSAGLALVLMAIGGMVLYAKDLVPKRMSFTAPALRYVPVFSAVVVMVLGLLMTGASMGWIRVAGIGG